MNSPQFSISYDGADSLEALQEVVELADEAGASNVWLACHLFHREPIACAAMTLARSRNIRVVLMAMSPFTVHPVYATMAAATLDEYFPGRVQLCFGVGAPRDLEAVGIVAQQPVQTLRETIGIARTLLAGETIHHEGKRFQVSGRKLASGARRIPIWLAASGPLMLELAGEQADGVLISAATSPAFIGWTLDAVARGEARAGRRIARAALVFTSVHADGLLARNRLRRQLGFILRGQHHAQNLELAGTRLDQTALAKAFANEDWTTVESLMTDDVIAQHTASGTHEQVKAALSAYRDVGLDEIVTYGIRDRHEMADMLAVMRA